ncbi:hypothetical protein F5Y02DRAFT_405009, partial [Annulohypoxylon stygium]
MPGFHVNYHITGRHIKATRSGGKMLPVGILRRKCSVCTYNSISNTIVLCDPKVTLSQTIQNKQPSYRTHSNIRPITAKNRTLGSVS